jgi:hypothetical protein
LLPISFCLYVAQTLQNWILWHVDPLLSGDLRCLDFAELHTVACRPVTKW